VRDWNICPLVIPRTSGQIFSCVQCFNFYIFGIWTIIKEILSVLVWISLDNLSNDRHTCMNIQLFNGCGCNRLEYLPWGNNQQKRKCVKHWKPSMQPSMRSKKGEYYSKKSMVNIRYAIQRHILKLRNFNFVNDLVMFYWHIEKHFLGKVLGNKSVI
jgi:hypothetical protein